MDGRVEFISHTQKGEKKKSIHTHTVFWDYYSVTTSVVCEHVKYRSGEKKRKYLWEIDVSLYIYLVQIVKNECWWISVLFSVYGFSQSTDDDDVTLQTGETFSNAFRVPCIRSLKTK